MRNSHSNVVHVCAWCKDCKKRTEDEQAKGNAVSHGICEKCAKKYFR